MARGELLRKLFLSQKLGDKEEFKAVALEIIAEEEKKNNHRLAQDLLRILSDNESASFAVFNNKVDSSSLPKDTERQTILVDVRYPDSVLEDILLKPSTLQTINQVLDEYSKAEILNTHGLKPRTKLLFCGPPGCGKTFCAGVVSRELGLPMLYCRFDSIVSSYLGETAANLRRVFDYASSGHWVVFFDEFDAIGKARDDPAEHGEIKRVVNSFLQLLDSFQSDSIVIAATNHEQLLDSAIWRRFDEVLFFPPPTIHEIRTLVSMKLKNFPHRELNSKEMAPLMKGMSHADVEHVCLDAVRYCILNGQDSVNEAEFLSALKRQQARMKVMEQASKKTK